MLLDGAELMKLADQGFDKGEINIIGKMAVVIGCHEFALFEECVVAKVFAAEID